MKILLTGANGYVGKRLLPELLELGHEVICCVRDKSRLGLETNILTRITVWEVDFLAKVNLNEIPKDIDIAYYLIHSMSSSTKSFDIMEAIAANNFNVYAEAMNLKQVIYLSGIVNDPKLSKHMLSRNNVEKILQKGAFNLTVLKAGIIVGSGSSSFEIIRDLCEKLPIMIAPKWVLTKTQPIAIRNVIQYLTGVINKEECFNQSYDIGGPNILTYKQMMQLYSKTRGLSLKIITVPVMTPKLSSYWLYFVTSTSYKLAMNLVDSMKVEVVCKDNSLQKLLNIKPISYVDAIKLAFKKIEQNLVVSSWKNSSSSSRFNKTLSDYIQVPIFGCLKDHQKIKLTNPEKALKNIWSIGGSKGWYYGNYLWQIRGFIDKLFGGVGLRRGRSNPTELNNGDALDFWRVILANKEEKRLLLYAEMKLPGEAWLEFKIDNNTLHQIATFRPKGLFGRLYWYFMLPFHFFIFSGMIKNISQEN